MALLTGNPLMQPLQLLMMTTQSWTTNNLLATVYRMHFIPTNPICCFYVAGFIFNCFDSIISLSWPVSLLVHRNKTPDASLLLRLQLAHADQLKRFEAVLEC